MSSPLNGISALQKEKKNSGAFLSFSSRERTKQESAIYEPESKPSLDIKSNGTLSLYFLASGTVRNKFLLFISYPVSDIMKFCFRRSKTNTIFSYPFQIFLSSNFFTGLLCC
jgi:hypothetical protein